MFRKQKCLAELRSLVKSSKWPLLTKPTLVVDDIQRMKLNTAEHCVVVEESFFLIFGWVPTRFKLESPYKSV